MKRPAIRVAYLCGEYPRATDTFIQREVAALRDSGAHVETLSVRKPISRESGSAEQHEERERTHYLLPCSPVQLILDHAGLFFRSPLRYAKALATAVRVRAPGLRSLCYQAFYFAEAGLVASRLRRQGLTHLHNHAPDSSGFVTMLAAQLGGLTYSFTLHGYGILTEPSRWRLTEKLNGALFVICISEYARGQAMLWSDRSQWPRYHVVHCGVDPESFQLRQHTDSGNRLLFVGRLDVVKGLPVLLEALADLMRRSIPFHLDIVGDGPQRAELETLAEQLGLSSVVSFHGYLPQQETRKRLAESDVFVMTSFYEGIPVALMEAMVAGVPVIAPHITGIPELVEDGVNGFLTPSGDVVALVARLAELLRSTELRQRLGVAGRVKVEREFHLAKETAVLIHVFTQRLNHEPAGIRPIELLAGDRIE